MRDSASVVRYNTAMITTTCANCGKPFQTWPRTLRRNANPTCSRQCNGAMRSRELVKHSHKGRSAWTAESLASYRQKMSGANNPAWKGGVTFFKTHGNYTGVRYVRAPEWARPMARKDGYVMEHRLVMAQIVGRLLTRTEVVHHLDHDPANNEPQNLELWPTNGAHKSAEHGRPVNGAACRLSLAD